MSKTSVKKMSKEEREQSVLLGLIDHYIKEGKPVGSNTLKDVGFQELSSATLRNYFAALEEQGYLIQQHSSGGRIPTAAAYRFYAEKQAETYDLDPSIENALNDFRAIDNREISSYLQHFAEKLSEITGTAVFLSAPRFDHDFVIDLKLVFLDPHRSLCILLSDFGVIRTELLHADHKLTAHEVKRMENYFHYRLTGNDLPENMTETELELAQRWYNEVMVRYIIGYAHFNEDEIFRTGFSQLLRYPEFEHAASLAHGLALFENRPGMRLLLRECLQHKGLKWWIDEDLTPYTRGPNECAVIAHPYMIHQAVAGAVALLGPMRLPYQQLFSLLRHASATMSKAMTDAVYKYKLSYRQPQEGIYLLGHQERLLIPPSNNHIIPS